MTDSAKTGRRGSWTTARWSVPAALLFLVLVVLAARWARELTVVDSFLQAYPGKSDLPDGAPVGIPAWLGWQHFLNVFLMVLIVRSGWLIRTTTRPEAYWTRENTGLVKTRRPPQKMSLNHWLHQSLDTFWVINGIVFFILLLVTDQWMRIVPMSWGVFPNAASAALQYLSLDWPTEGSWASYNALQVLTYFTTVFVAAPLAVATGLRLSSIWPSRWERFNRLYSVETARRLHFPIMLYFVAFTVMHVVMVFSTGALRNLNHMYGARGHESWFGFWVFAISILVVAGAWVAARPLFLRSIASLHGRVTRH